MTGEPVRGGRAKGKNDVGNDFDQSALYVCMKIE
jgi:hypothetical protein